MGAAPTDDQRMDTAANGGNTAADGSTWRRQVSVSGGKRQQTAAGTNCTSFTVAAAAAELGVPERTLREWIRLGKIEALPPRPGERGARISASTLEDLRTTKGEESEPSSLSVPAADGGNPTANGGNWQQAAAEGNSWRQQTAADLSPGAAGLSNDIVTDDTTATALKLAEQRAAMLESERDRLVTDMDHLRAQLEVRTHEIQQERTAGEQLRVMLMKLEATNAELAGALVVKALPPAPEETPRRTRWWQLWK
jgi:excisionase family DNA binding protein